MVLVLYSIVCGRALHIGDTFMMDRSDRREANQHSDGQDPTIAVGAISWRRLFGYLKPYGGRIASPCWKTGGLLNWAHIAN